MKKFKSILAIVILAAISYSCNNSAVLKVMEEPETGIIVSDENKAKFEDQINTFRTFTKAFHDEDINQLMSVVARFDESQGDQGSSQRVLSNSRRKRPG